MRLLEKGRNAQNRARSRNPLERKSSRSSDDPTG